MILVEYMLLSVAIGVPLGIAWRLVDIALERRTARQVAAVNAEPNK